MNLSVVDLEHPTSNLHFLNVSFGVKYTILDYKSPINPTSTSFYREYQIEEGESGAIKPIMDSIKLDENEVFRTFKISAINKKEKKKEGDQQKEKEINKPTLVIDGKEIDMSQYHGIIHSKPYSPMSSNTFNYFGWQNGGKKKYFVYHAEKKFDDTKDDSSILRESWGEGMTSIIDPVLVLVEFNQESSGDNNNSNNNNLSSEYNVRIIDFDGIAISKPQIVNNILYFIGYKSKPFKYGVYYVHNRPSSIYKYDLTKKDSTLVCLITEPASINDLVVFENKMAFVGNTILGSHFKTASLYFMDLDNDGGEKSLIRGHDDADKSEINDNNNSGTAFKVRKANNSPNLYLLLKLQDALPNGRVYFNNAYKHDQRIYYIDMKTETVECAYALDDHSYMLASRTDNRFLAFQRQDQYPMILFNSNKEKDKDSASEKLIKLNLFQEYQFNFDSLEQSIIKISEFVEIIVLKPKTKDGEKLPLIFFPHGGPNSVYLSVYSPVRACFALAGYAMASVNYTGSIGYGEESIKRLEANVGILDVKDCMESLGKLKEQSYIDSNKLFYFGGSHGGYLGAMLTAKYPDAFKAAVIINPVIDYQTMSTSDIPDYRFSLFNMPYDFEHPCLPTLEEIKVFIERSPSYYAKSVKTPTLLLLGTEDKRVPWHNGYLWYKLLKANGVSVEAHIYQDNHSLGKPLSDRGEIVNSLNFFNKYRQLIDEQQN